MGLQYADLIDAGSASWRGDFGIGHITVQQMPMSAFPESGRSDQQKLGETKVRFRPQADIEISEDKLRHNHDNPDENVAN